MDGTTKRKRRTKQELEAERIEELKESCKKQEQGLRLRRALGKDGVYLHVRAKEGGRVVRHRIAVTHKGQVLFVDHGMCTPQAMIAEMELRKLPLNQILQEDVCFAMALLLARLEHPYVRHIPVKPEKRSHGEMTEKLKVLYSEEAYKFIRDLEQKRATRKSVQQWLRYTIMNPFCHTVSARLRALADKKHAQMVSKIRRVEARLSTAGFNQDHTTYGYAVEPGKLPP